MTNKENTLTIEIEYSQNSHHEDFKEVVMQFPYILEAFYSESRDSILATVLVKDASNNDDYFEGIAVFFEQEDDIYISDGRGLELWSFDLENPIIKNSEAAVWHSESKSMSEKNNLEVLAHAMASIKKNRN